MSNERVQFNLTERFAAPLPEFYRRRIIFWKDEDREFEKDVDALNLEGVKIVKLTGTNNFAVKKLLLHDDLESNYLIYIAFQTSVIPLLPEPCHCLNRTVRPDTRLDKSAHHIHQKHVLSNKKWRP